MKTKTLILCDNVSEAYLIKGRLNNEGIECFLTNENITNLMPHYNNMLGSGIQIIVKEDDLAAARQIIKDKLEPDNDNIVCPYCGSTKIGLGFGKHKGNKVINIFIVILAMISVSRLFPLGKLKPMYYCKTCGKDIK